MRSFTLLPAVDVAGGRVVGGGDPRPAALALQADGAAWLHLVDLDAAYGRGSNAELLAALIGELDVDVELSGGIRDDASLELALSTGCSRVVVATDALDDPRWSARVIAAHGDRLVVALDVRAAGREYRLAARGGDRAGGDLSETLAWLDRIGCRRYVVTDVSTDGALSGPNLELHGSVCAATPGAVVASGGVASIDDLIALAGLASAAANLEGAIVGSALHAGRFTLPEALAALS